MVGGDFHTSVAVVTIDGPSGSGKGTLSRLLAKKLGWHLLDSGLLYRLTALTVQNRAVDLADEISLVSLVDQLDIKFVHSDSEEGLIIFLDGKKVSQSLRTEEIGALASKIAAVPSVRQMLLDRQRELAQKPGLVADGRDMGTVVFPHADVKIFLSASAEERAKRRHLQLLHQGVNADFTRILSEIKSRDQRDCEREISPLLAAEDALMLDNTGMSIEESLYVVWSEMELKGLV